MAELEAQLEERRFEIGALNATLDAAPKKCESLGWDLAEGGNEGGDCSPP